LLRRVVEARAEIPEGRHSATVTIDFSQQFEMLGHCLGRDDAEAIRKEVAAAIKFLGYEPVRVACRAISEDEDRRSYRAARRLRRMRRKDEAPAVGARVDAP
jgi:hypothetical protein